MRNPFTKDPDLKQKEIESNINALAEQAKKCLAQSDFIKYKQEFIKVKNEIENAMFENVDPDPIKDAFFLRACLNKLHAFKLIIDMVEKDSKKEIV